jgi:hypothetical protein
MAEVASAASGQPRFTTLVMSVFAGVAFLLAALGLYGILASSVEQRIREIGVRVALGAARGEVLRLVIGHGMKLTLIGAIVGVPAAPIMTRLIGGVLPVSLAPIPSPVPPQSPCWRHRRSWRATCRRGALHWSIRWWRCARTDSMNEQRKQIVTELDQLSPFQLKDERSS